MVQHRTYHAFFSYASADAAADPKLIEALTIDLEQRVNLKFFNDRFEIWRDIKSLRLGDRWEPKLEAALRSSDALIVLLTPRWLGSDHCRKEYEIFEQAETDRSAGGAPVSHVATILARDIEKEKAKLTSHQALLFNAIRARQYGRLLADDFLSLPRARRNTILDEIADDIHEIIERRGTLSDKTSQADLKVLSLMDIADWDLEQGDLAGALKSCREALASIEQSILSQSSRSEHWKEHSASYERIADLLRAMGHEEEAQLAGTRLLKARERAEKIKFGASHRPVQATRTDERSRDFDNRLVAFLRRHPFFSDLDPRSLDQLSRYAKHLDLKRGTRIFSKGDPGTSLFAVISGTVRISASYPDGRSAILNLVGPGELFGEIAVLDGQARSADAIASTNCELSAFDRRDFLPFVRTQPTLVMRLIELLCARLRSTSGQVEQIMLLDLPGRLAGALLNLAHGHRGVSNRTITITHQEIGEMIGTSRESVNKQLRAWAARQWVQLEHGRIVILEAEPLRALLEAKVGRT